jgi:hypothetical protein
MAIARVLHTPLFPCHGWEKARRYKRDTKSQIAAPEIR